MALDYATQLLRDAHICKLELWRAIFAYGPQALDPINSNPSCDGILALDRQDDYWDVHVQAPSIAGGRSSQMLAKIGVEGEANMLRVVGRVRRLQQAEGPCMAVVELAFRGTDTAYNWLTNFSADLVPSELGTCRGHIHQGFQTAYFGIREQMLEKLNGDLAACGLDSLARHVTVRITGHSLGGALATLAAYDLTSKFSCELHVVTWGCPRIGDAEFAASCRETLPRMVRFVTKMDPVPRLPLNPQDPYDDGALISEFLSGSLAKTQVVVGAVGYCHVCPSVMLDRKTSNALHFILGSMEVAVAFQEGGAQSFAEHFIAPHKLAAYADSLHQLLTETKLQKRKEWMKLPSVGTWLQHRYPVRSETRVLDAQNEYAQLWESSRSELHQLFDYYSMFMQNLQGQGPCVLLDLESQLGRFTQRQIEALGLESDATGKVSMQAILQARPQLLETEQGQHLLRRAQKRIVDMLPLLAVAADEQMLGGSSAELSRQLERNGVGRKLMSWGRRQLELAEQDPEMLQRCLASFEFSSASFGGSSSSASGFMSNVKQQCTGLVYSEAAQDALHELGVRFDEDGSVQVDEVLSKARQLLETPAGRQALKTTQKHALEILDALHAKANGAGSAAFMKQLGDTPQAHALLAWGQKTLAVAKSNPDALKTLLSSLDLPSSADDARMLHRPHDLSLNLNGLVENCQGMLESEQAAGLMREAQRKALDWVPVLAVKAGEAGLAEQLSKMQNSSRGSELLEQGRELLASAEQDPDALKRWVMAEASRADEWKSWGSDLLVNTSGSRDDLVRVVKERCLDFLSEQLPMIKIPPIVKRTDGVEFQIENIDLSAFKVDKDHVTVEFMKRNPHQADTKVAESESRTIAATTGEVLRVTAKELAVSIPQLFWTYRQLKFPYLYGEGKAETQATGGCITLSFRLNKVETNAEFSPRFTLACADVAIDQFLLEVCGSRFSWVYNTAAGLFQDSIKSYVISSLHTTLKDNIMALLSPLNMYVRPHWALLLRTCGLTLSELPEIQEHGAEHTALLESLIGTGAAEHLGAEFGEVDGKLVLRRLDPSGALAHWNEIAQEPRRVRVSDVLLEVDATRGSPAALLQALQKWPLVELVFCRGQ
eukprot:TRINITY_DN58860_c0_g1_i1.p1 TRINITY_DN58860_c0_g1~~TRINITY_DN58860_c0_g1_i1.p1  ORF type:complete len:1129 (+),score=210.06 TRINITY_DN58860_c0_g1_i1:48-3389(+)